MTHARMRFWIRTASRLGRQGLSSLLIAALIVSGCAGPNDEPYYVGSDKDLDYYEDVSLRIEHSDICQETTEPVAASQGPRLLGDNNRDPVWEMTLVEAIHLALTNNRIVRTRGEFLSPGNQLYNNPEGVTSVYDPAIRETGVLFGGRGVESALSAFDTQFTTRLLWNENKQVQNSLFALNGLTPGTVLDQDGAQFVTSLSKQFAYGANAQFSHTWNYDANNLPGRLFRSAYTGNVQFQYRQPLLAGAGTEFTRIAGPAGDNIQGITGVNQGVIIARISTDISLVDFESQVGNMVKDVEDLYWDLYLAYRVYDSEIVARNSALRTWREVEAKRVLGARGGGAADEAQAREAYFDARSRVEDALGGNRTRTGNEGLYALELRLRRLCGLPVNDGRVIRPADEPITAELIPDWHCCLAESLTLRDELRRQKWTIKSLDLQLTAANSLKKPRLDFVSSYQINGFGDRLIDGDGPDGTNGAEFQSAYRSITRYEQTGYTAGFEFSQPLGMRSANAQVRNLELRLTKAREVLAQQELEISHELANAFQGLAWRYVTAQTNFNRRRAAERQVQAFEAEYAAGTRTLDLLLQAQSRLAQAEIAYYQSLTEYNKALTDLQYRKGTLLQHNNIILSEGEWTPDAYRDALRRAWARTYAIEPFEFDPLRAEPEPFSLPGSAGGVGFINPGPLPGEPAPLATEGDEPRGVPVEPSSEATLEEALPGVTPEEAGPTARREGRPNLRPLPPIEEIPEPTP